MSKFSGSVLFLLFLFVGDSYALVELEEVSNPSYYGNASTLQAEDVKRTMEHNAEKSNLNFSALDTSKAAKPYVNALAPADISLDWYDTDQEPGVWIHKKHSGTTWERVGSHGVQYLPDCAGIAAGLCVNTGNGKLYYHNNTAVVEVGTASGSYTLPTASANTLGGIKVGARLTITDGVLSADVQSGTGAVDSVNGATGTIVLDADDISDASTTKKFTTSAEKATWNAKQNTLVAGTDYLAPTGSAAGLTGFPTLNQNTTGSAARLSTARTIAGSVFDGTANIDISYENLLGTPTLGTAAALDVGTAANNVVRLNGSGQLPAMDGSLLTGISGSIPSGTIGQGLQYNSTTTVAPIDYAPLAFTDNVSRNSTTGVVSVPVTATPTSGSAVPLTSGGAYTAIGGKQDTLVSGENIKTINNTSLLGGGNIDIAGGTGGYVTLSAVPYSDVPCTTGQYGKYESTGYLCTDGFWTSKWTLTTHSNASPVTYILTIDGTGWNGTDSVSVGGSIYIADGDKTGLSGTVSITVTPGTGREATCSGTRITGSASPYSFDASGDSTLNCTFSDIVAASFAGSPGTTETFESGTGAFITGTNFSETDPQSIINTYSTTQYKNGTHSAYFGFTGAESNFNFIKADAGSGDSGFTLSYWLRIGSLSAWNNEILFSMSQHSTMPYSYGENALATMLSDQNGGTNYKVIVYDYMGGSSVSGTINYPTGTWIKLQYEFRSGGTSDIKIYNSSNVLQETISVSNTPSLAIRYFYWGEVLSANQTALRPFYIDDVQYNSTNP